jgi:4-aminobutyrate---pyruvate transaminase
MTPLSNLAARDIESLLHPYTNLLALRESGPLVIERGSGIHLYDRSGKEYIDGMAGLWCAALGYGNEELVDAATRQMRNLSFQHLFGGRSHESAIALAEKLKEIAPVPTSKIFFCNSGSEANDSAIKLLWYVNNALGRPKKKKIISRRRAHHGVTVASASLTSLPAAHRDFDLPISGFLYACCPHHYRFAREGESEEDFAGRLAAALEELILREGPSTVAAFIAEPVMGAGGVIVPPASYFEKVTAVCEKYAVHMISDEVICGFGRLGSMFGCNAFGFRAQTVTVGKALTSAYVPMAALAISEPMYQVLLDQSRKIGVFGHGFTYSGHPVAAAVALKVLEILERDRVVEQVARKAGHFQARLRALGAHPLCGEARGYGLVGGLELSAEKKSRRRFERSARIGARAVRSAEEEGLMLRALIGDVIAICPPLIITPAEIDALFDRLTCALDRTLDWAKREGHVKGTL